MKKILLAVLVMAVVAAVAVGGTVAYLSTTSNPVTASVAMAKPVLKAGGPGWVGNLFDMKGVVPGQSWTQDVYVQNTGDTVLYITPTWSPDPQTGDNSALDKAIEPIVPVLVDGATLVKDGVYSLAVGAQAHFQVTVTMRETHTPQNDLQGMTLHYKGGFYGSTSLADITAYTVGG